MQNVFTKGDFGLLGTRHCQV